MSIDAYTITLGDTVRHEEYGDGHPVTINPDEMSVYFEECDEFFYFSFPGTDSTQRSTNELTLVNPEKR